MVLGVLSSLSKILLRMGALLLYFNCVVAVCILCLYLMVPLVGLQSVIVAFAEHTHSTFGLYHPHLGH